jgi:hypothetical protein
MGATDWKTTLRGFLSHGGRVLVAPDGMLSEGGGLPRFFVQGDLPETETAMAACRAYFAQRDPSSRAKVKRTALMFGQRTSNGWHVLEGVR